MKSVQEIELFLKNEPGQLSAISELLGANGINIIAIYVSAAEKGGKLRFVANDPQKASNILKTAGYQLTTHEVIACETPHHPGGLNAVLKPLKAAEINVDYIYPCIGTGSITVLILGVDSVGNAVKVMEENWIRVLGSDLYRV